MSELPEATRSERGYIIPLGGAEKKSRDTIILDRIAHLARDRGSGYVVVIPSASELDETGPRYVKIFKELGVEDAVQIPLETRADCERSDYLSELEKATAIFITGGNQLRLSSIIGGTSVDKMIRNLNRTGIHVAGTSAGAAILCEHMIAGGTAGSTPFRKGVSLAPGLGLTNRIIIDQHFRQRARLGRLLAAIAYSPSMSGIGLDEDTAAFIDPYDKFEVVGSGVVTVVDPGQLEYSSMGIIQAGQPPTLIGMTVHILAAGASYDLRTRVATPAPRT